MLWIGNPVGQVAIRGQDHESLAILIKTPRRIDIGYADIIRQRWSPLWIGKTWQHPVGLIECDGADRHAHLERYADRLLPSAIHFQPERRGNGHLTHIIHERFYCNRRYATATSLASPFSWPGGQEARPSGPQHTVSSMPRSLRAPRARLAWRLGGFVTNRHE